MAAEEEWYFEEEGCLQFSGRPISVTFSPASNCFISTLEDGTIEVVDARSSLRLKRTSTAENTGSLQCRFCPEVEKLFITNGYVSGLRKDLNGVLLLDSILQPPLKGPCLDPVVLELTLSDALQLLSAMEMCISAAEDDVRMKCMKVVHSMLKEEVDKAQSLLSSSHDKAIKWCTCQLKYACSALDAAFGDLITYLQRSCKNHAALPVISAVQSRTMYLLEVVTTDNKPSSPGNKSPMFMEAVRRKTFSSWPHKEYRWAYPEAMAKAGFYHQPSNRGDDRALCFTCNVCLVCWEPTDEPWSEHERHCPDCSFVRGDHTKNVPMSVSLATAPACAHESTHVKVISESSCSHYIATCSEDGHVIIWNIQDELKIHTEFQVDLPDDITNSQAGDVSASTGPPTSFIAWAEPDNEEDIEGTSTEQDNDSEDVSEALTPVSNGDGSCKEEASTPSPTLFQNTSEECKNSQDEEKSAADSPSENTDSDQQNDKHKLTVCSVSIVCSCGKDPTNNAGQKCQSFGHTATLVLAIFVGKNYLTSDAAKAEGKHDSNATAATQLLPYILVYDILTDSGNKLGETTSKQHFNVDSSTELEKEMLMLTPSGSDDDWMYDQLPVYAPPPPPVLPPDTLHSSVLQKFAEAIAGENEDKGKTNKSREEPNRYRKLQCLGLSLVCKGQCCKVSNIVPFGDGQYLLISFEVCSSCSDKVKLAPNGSSRETETTVQSSDDSSAEAANNSSQEINHNCGHNFNQMTLAVYRIVINDGKRMLSQQPTRTKPFAATDGLFSSIVPLPLEGHDHLGDLCFQEAEAEHSLPSQLLVAAVRESVVLMDANSLNILTKFTASNGDSRITHVLNCPGMDCFCACTEDGMMHFLGLRHQQAGEASLGSTGEESTDGTAQAPSAGSWSQSAVALDPDEPVTMASLLSLVQLTEFVTLMPRFTASVPSSWVEVQQDQQRLHQHSLLDPVLHTRTWKLRSDSSSFLTKEQVVELVLPRYCHVGHVDIRFSLSPMTSQPATNVYLVKPPYPGSFKPNQKAFTPPVAEHLKKGILNSAREQSTIVCGPVNLKLGLDSTGRHGRVTLTSPELIKSSSRILLIVLDSCGPNEDLTEVSITVTRFKNNFPADCHKLRSSLLEDSCERLLDIVVGSELVLGAKKVNDGRKLALELLCWIAGICVNCNTGNNSLVQDVEIYLPKLIQICFLSCGRSIAHKCSRLLVMCGRKAAGQRTSSDSTSSFRRSLLDAILNVLRATPCAVSSGAVQWLFKLLTGFAAQADSTLTSFVCLELLELLSSKLATSRLREHLFLRARCMATWNPLVLYNKGTNENVNDVIYTSVALMDHLMDHQYGLNGCPLDPVLFDAVPQPPTTPQSPPVVNCLSGLSVAVKGTLASGNSDHESWSGVNSPLACQGLLEVQPLHFVCCSTSDGARVERGDTQQMPGGSLGPTGPSVAVPMMSGGIPSSSALATTLPNVTDSLVALEVELQMLKQHQQQLVSLQQHKQQLEKHKKELEDLSMLSLFPKFLYKAGDVWNPPPTTQTFPAPAGTPMSSTSTLINLAQHKKQASSAKKQERATGVPASQPIQQHLTQPPLPQMLVIDRLHAGARHHVVLDFGCVVQLTDVLIPQCSDIMSLSVDVWTLWDDPDVQRVAVVSDINLCACVLKDLLPPPVCRYVKLTVVGRPKTNAKARVKIGEFYGHPLCGQTSMNGETQLLDAGCNDKQCLPILQNLLEDIHCHYNLACTQLRILLQSSEPRNPRMGATVKGTSLTEEERKVHKAYNQCMNLQRQLNLVEQSINRLTSNAESNGIVFSLDEAKYDHLQVICKCLIDTVVALMGIGPSLDGYLAKPKLALEWQPWLSQVTPAMCENLFRNLCVHGSPQKRERVGALLLNACGSKPWWGEFLSNVLKEFFSSDQKCTFPQERLFTVLVSLSQQSPSLDSVLTSFLSLLDGLLLLKDLKVDLESVDLTLVGWLLLLLQHVLDTCIVQCEPTSSGTAENGDNSKSSSDKNGGTSTPTSSKSRSSKPAKSNKSCKRSRWDFMLPMPATQPAGQSSDNSFSRWQKHMKMSKCVFPKKPPAMKPPSDYSPSQQSLTKGNGKQPYKHMKGLPKLRRLVDEGKPQPEKTTSQPTVFSTSTPLPASTTVPVMHKMISFILSMNSTCSVELFLVACKVVAHLSCVSEPSICLVDVVTDGQLEQLMRMCVMPSGTHSAHWGGPWASHSLTSLLQDLLQGGQGSKSCDTPKNGTAQTPAVQKNGTESPPVTSIMEAKEKSILLADVLYVGSYDLYPDYELASEGELQAPSWMGELGDIGNSNEMPQPTPVHEKPVIPSSWEAKIGPPPVKLSSAIDMRLELGVEMEAEQDLKMLEHLQVDAIAKALSTTMPPSKGTTEQPRRTLPRNMNGSLVEGTLQASFSKIFNDCNSPNVDLPSLLQLWLKIRLCCSSLQLDTASLRNLMSHVVNQPGTSPQTQQHCMQVLTVVCEGQLINCANPELLAFLSNENLLKFLVRLLLQMPSIGPHSISPSSKPVKAFLTSLQSVVQGHNDATLSQLFQELLLRTILELCAGRLTNRQAVLQMEPVIDLLLGNLNAARYQVGPSIVIQLVKATTELSLDHLTHKRSISLLPSTDVLASAPSGVSADKLDNSAWLLQLLSLIIQILQNSPVKPPHNIRNQTVLDVTAESNQGQNSAELQGAPTNSCSSSSSSSSTSVTLSDKLVAEKELLLCLLECLNQCSADKQGVLSAEAPTSQDKLSADGKISGKATSVEDGVLQLLCVIQNQVSDLEVLVDGVLAYLQTSTIDDVEVSSTSVKNLSDPLLRFLFKLFGSSEAVTQFYEKGGLDIVCKAIVAGQATSLDHTSHGLLSVMRELTSRASRSEPSRSSTAIGENDWTKRMINFAPYGSINCTSSPRHPPDALLKATAQHRRARSAAWSFRFPANEEWCELVVSLPTAILLHEVHIQPHSTGLSTCPSHVSLDISNDSQVLVPVCEPVLTTGITVIKLKLEQAQVAQHVHIHCHCPRDSRVLGLSQIKIMGTSLHGSQSLVNQELQALKGQAVSLGWIQLLGHCLSQGPDLYQETKDPSTLLSDVFTTCIGLLLSPQSEGWSACLELVLMKLSVQFPELGTMLVKQLLKCPGDKKRMSGPIVNVATVELIYQLGKKQDSSYQDRLSVMSSWLGSMYNSSASIQTAPGPIQAIAAVIWHAKETDSESTVSQHFSEELFRSLYDWSQNISDQDAVKQSIDHLIGALSFICPKYYEVLLELTGTKEVLNHHCKKSADAGGALSSILSSPSRLATLATASQSAVTSQMLLNSGLLELMVQGIVDFCHSVCDSQDIGKDVSSSMSEKNLSQKRNCVPINHLQHLLRFLTCCCKEPAIKNWMGEGGYQFWFLLLSKLCGGPGAHTSSLFSTPGIASSLSRYTSFAVETATVELLCNCVHFHPKNQEKMACLLVETIGERPSSNASDLSAKPKVTSHVSGFIRQLILQMLLEEEAIPICLHIENDLNLQTFKGFDFFHKQGWHPRFGAGHSFVLLSAKLSSNLENLSEQILLPKPDKPVETPPEEKVTKHPMEGMADPSDFGYEGFEFLESVSLAAGLNVKSKRAEKNESLAAKENNPATVQHQNQRRNLSCSFYHELLGNVPQTVTLAQLLQTLMNTGLPYGSSYIELTCKTQGEASLQNGFSNVAPLLSPLDVFAKHDGLAQLSVHLPCHVIVPPSLTPDTEGGGTEVDNTEDRLPSYPTQLPLPLVSLPASVLSTVPAHSLVAFGLFIRLPGYYEVLLQDNLRARYLLRLLLGAKQDGDGEAILSSPVASSLSTLPFRVLRILFQGSELVPQEGLAVHRAAMEVGAIQMVLLCLAVLSHHKPRATSHSHKLALQALSALTGSVCRDNDIGAGNERSYWAKGTGFGTGSTSSGWDVEQAMLKQKAEEEHVTCLLQVLASYIKPFGKQSDSHKAPFTDYSQSSTDGTHPLVVVLLELLGESCLIPALSSYLRNDSVLDMARHVPLYQAVLEVLRAVALCPVLLPLLLPRSNGYSPNQQERASKEAPSIVSLLDKMKQCVDTYSKTLRSTQGRKEDNSGGPSTAAQPSTSTGSSSTAGTPSTSAEPGTSAGTSTSGVPRPGSSGQGATEDKKDQEAEGLAQLIPDIQETAKLMQKVVHQFHQQQQASCSKMTERDGNKPAEEVASLSAEERYLAKMKSLQFGTHRIVIEKDDGKLEFDSGGYHFASSLRSAATGGGSGGMVRARRLAQEVSSLATSLPLSSSSSVFVRCDKERLDVMKVLITGPSDTPYANGCFEFDVYFPQNYPESPMYINFETTGHHSIRFNPNLYNDGKVCLSILNTWHGRPEEKWNPQNSSFLQVLVSIQSLILVHEPYFNEPGYERSRGTPAGQQNSREYDANICQATVRWAMLEQLRKPSPCFKQVIQAHFFLKKDEILEQCERWIKDTESLLSGRPVGRAISHHVQSLKQNTELLKQELAKLEPPPDHKEGEEDSDEDSD